MSTPEATDLISRLRGHQVDTIEQVHEINGEPHQTILEKHTTYMTPLLEGSSGGALLHDRHGGCRRQLRCLTQRRSPSSVSILDRRTLVIRIAPATGASMAIATSWRIRISA